MWGIDRLLRLADISRVDHLPVVAAFCRRIRVREAINGVVPNQMQVDVGAIGEALVLDTLSGRSPLYRLSSFFQHQPSEPLLGRPIAPTHFNDTTVGRALDAIFEAGAEKVFNHVAWQAARLFPLDLREVHFDTTSVNVWGDVYAPRPGVAAVHLTHGYSKDHRPDLKQFLIRMLCAGGNVPILGGCEDGNASDKTVNHGVLTRISQHLARYGLKQGDFLYVADSALVTEENLEAVGANFFLTRLPFTYSEAGRMVAQAVLQKQWESVGELHLTRATTRRPAASYSVCEKSVTLYGQTYRAVVVRSTAHDKRRQKRLDRQIRESEGAARRQADQHSKIEFFCRPDAEAALQRLQAADHQLHRLEISIRDQPHYAPGRPPVKGPRAIAFMRWALDITVLEDRESIQRQREEAGCFVLLTNVPRQGDRSRTGAELLRSYKDQYGIERNYSFLKDPLIVNDLFLKRPERIEALGAVLLIALLVWNLIEHTLRRWVQQHNTDLPGWENRPTRRPTAFTMSNKFQGLQILTSGQLRRLTRPLNDQQQLYLQALSLSELDLGLTVAQPG